MKLYRGGVAVVFWLCSFVCHGILVLCSVLVAILPLCFVFVFFIGCIGFMVLCTVLVICLNLALSAVLVAMVLWLCVQCWLLWYFGTVCSVGCDAESASSAYTNRESCHT